MLDFLRSQARGWLVKVLFAVIIMSFALWGVGDYFSGQSAVAVATVGDQEITQQVLQRRMRSERDRLRRILGEGFDPDQLSNDRMRALALQQLIRERLLDLEARRLGLAVANAVVQNAIRSRPAFRQGGSFSPQRYQRLLDRMGLGPPVYESRVRQRLAVEGLRQFLKRASLVSEHEIWKAFQHQGEQRFVRYFRLHPSRFVDKVDLKEASVRQFYKANPDRYRRPAQVRLRYVILAPEAVAARFEPSEEQLQAYLEENAGHYGDGNQAPELETVREQVASDWRQDRAIDWIFKRLPTFKDLLYTRDNLAPVAEELGLDIRSSGWLPKSGPLPSEVPSQSAFREAAFAVESGSNSQAIELGDARFAGLHVVERRPPSVRPFETVQGEVRRDLRHKRARELVAKKARRAKAALDKGRPLEVLAQENGVPVEKAGPATREQATSRWPAGLAGPVFAAQQGGHGAVALGSPHHAVFEVAKVIAPEREALSESRRSKLRQRLRRSRGQTRMRAFFDHLRERYGTRIHESFRAGKD